MGVRPCHEFNDTNRPRGLERVYFFMEQIKQLGGFMNAELRLDNRVFYAFEQQFTKFD